jgi:hypothetical protein
VHELGFWLYAALEYARGFGCGLGLDGVGCDACAVPVAALDWVCPLVDGACCFHWFACMAGSLFCAVIGRLSGLVGFVSWLLKWWLRFCLFLIIFIYFLLFVVVCGWFVSLFPRGVGVCAKRSTVKTRPLAISIASAVVLADDVYRATVQGAL